MKGIRADKVRMIKVASYNIRKAIGTDRRRRPGRILDVLRELDADVVALQEVDRRFGTRASALPGNLIDRESRWQAIPFGTRSASIGWHGNTILIPKGATIAATHRIHLPSLEPRGAVTADIALADGRALRIVGMHLDLSGLWRRRQARAIISRIEELGPALPTILMGDLNEWSATTGCLHEFARHYRIADTGPSFHARRPVARLDRILMSRDLRIVDCGVEGGKLARTASDHLPIWAMLGWPS